MEMIIGGAYQGKNAYAVKEHSEIVFQRGADLDEKALLKAEGVLGFQDYIRKELKEGRSLLDLAEKIIEQNPNIVIVSEEVGYGVVPVDAFDRVYREAVGRICTKLAAYSRKVTRVICGIGTVIKDA